MSVRVVADHAGNIVTPVTFAHALRRFDEPLGLFRASLPDLVRFEEHDAAGLHFVLEPISVWTYHIPLDFEVRLLERGPRVFRWEPTTDPADGATLGGEIAVGPEGGGEATRLEARVHFELELHDLPTMFSPIAKRYAEHHLRRLVTACLTNFQAHMLAPTTPDTSRGAS